jgi:hypothetical protein
MLNGKIRVSEKKLLMIDINLYLNLLYMNLLKGSRLSELKIKIKIVKII